MVAVPAATEGPEEEAWAARAAGCEVDCEVASLVAFEAEEEREGRVGSTVEPKEQVLPEVVDLGEVAEGVEAVGKEGVAAVARVVSVDSVGWEAAVAEETAGGKAVAAVAAVAKDLDREEMCKHRAIDLGPMSRWTRVVARGCGSARKCLTHSTRCLARPPR